MAVARLTRRVAFSAAHRYFRPEWSDAENRRVFGACANEGGHGHNYLLDVTVEAGIDHVTGFSADLAALDTLLHEEVVAVLDHQHINHAIDAFRPGGLVPTCENLVRWLWPRIDRRLGEGATLVRLRLHEDATLFVDYFGDGTGV
jgi:6-pyruvoyltetrahydropterin/6-carboxytetrahydropterin synthase